MKPRHPTEKLPYKEGTWFAVPLRRGKYAIGRVARLAPEGRILLVYLFGPKLERVPELGEIDHLEPYEAVKVFRVGDLGLVDGSWPVVGDSPRWERDRWPIPAFVRRDEISKLAWRVIYSDDNPNAVISEQRIPFETPGLETDGFYGSTATEHVLSAILEP